LRTVLERDWDKIVGHHDIVYVLEGGSYQPPQVFQVLLLVPLEASKQQNCEAFLALAYGNC